MVEHSALVRLLVDKGVITFDEYFESLATVAEEEKALYEKWLNKHFGRDGAVRLS